MIKTPIVTALNNTTFVAVTLGTDDAFGFDIICDDSAIGFTIHNVITGGTAAIPAAKTLSFTHYEAAGEIVMYAKAASGSPNLVLIPHKHHKG
jgi:hypothetical protein